MIIRTVCSKQIMRFGFFIFAETDLQNNGDAAVHAGFAALHRYPHESNKVRLISNSAFPAFYVIICIGGGLEMELSEKLKKLRSERGLSQQKLADMIFVSRSAVAKWENGLGLPSEESYEALAAVFGVPKAFFVTDEPEQIITTKNRKMKKLSGFNWAVIIMAIAALALYALFHPVRYYASAKWDKIAVAASQTETFEIAEKEQVEAFIDVLNAAAFRKSRRLDAEAPDTLKVAVTMMEDGSPNRSCADIYFCLTDHGKCTVYIWNGTEELTVYPAEAAEKLYAHVRQWIAAYAKGQPK